jgi:hypothetical protein
VAPVLHHMFMLRESVDDTFLARVVDTVLASAPRRRA